MTDLEKLLTALAIILPVLTYFAGVQRGKLNSKRDRRDKRIAKVIEAYMRDQSNLVGMMRAGAGALHDEDEVQELCTELRKRGKDPIPSSYRDALKGVSLLKFFQEIAANPNHIENDGTTRALIETLKKV